MNIKVNYSFGNVLTSHGHVFFSLMKLIHLKGLSHPDRLRTGVDGWARSD